MWREETVEELSDGKFYTANDMVKIGTNDCLGCCDCCRMAPVIVLDPLDVFELNRFLQQSFEALLNETIELKVIDGLILPVLKLVHGGENAGSDSPAGTSQNRETGETEGEHSAGTSLNRETGGTEGEHSAGTSLKPQTRGAEEASPIEEPMVCPYLGEDGRCTIHEFRPGICRLYPLGRSWENDDFSYILQVGECTRCNGTKVKVKKWLQIPDLPTYENFCRDWHSLLTKARRLLEGGDPQSRMRNQVCVYLLQQFYLCDWNVDDFYAVFAQRRAEALRHLGFAGN